MKKLMGFILSFALIGLDWLGSPILAEEHSSLYRQVEQRSAGSENEVVDGSERMTTVTDEAGNVLVAEVYDQERATYITTTATTTEAIIEKTVAGVVTREVYHYLDLPEAKVVLELARKQVAGGAITGYQYKTN